MAGGTVDPTFLLFSLLDEDCFLLDGALDSDFLLFSLLSRARGRDRGPRPEERLELLNSAVVARLLSRWNLWCALYLGWLAFRAGTCLRPGWDPRRVCGPTLGLFSCLGQSLRWIFRPLRQRPDLGIIYHLLLSRAFEPSLVFLLFL